MTFRTKLLLITSLTVAGTVALATGAVSLWTRMTFERIDLERRQAVLRQFEDGLTARGKEVAHRVQRAASTDTSIRAAIEASRPDPDLSLLVNDAQTLAETQSLDFVDVVQPDLTIVSSAHWSARFGYKNDWLVMSSDWNSADAFLTRIPTPDGQAVALAAVHAVSAGGKKLYVIGAERLDSSFLASLGAAPGTRAMLWLAPGDVLDAKGPVSNPGKLDPLAAEVQRTLTEQRGAVRWTNARDSAEALQAVPLARDGKLLCVLIAGTPLRDQIRLQRSILWTGLLVGGSGILLGMLIGWWTTERVTRPVRQLAAGARAVAGGDWSAQVEVTSKDEIGELAASFNRMTGQLIEQRERTVQAERVAAWRELARRLAHELKNPLFPLQITVENMRKAREQNSSEFHEIFEESTATLLAELSNLRGIIGRFSDFAKMPLPQLEPVDVNQVVRDVMQLFDATFKSGLHPQIEPVLELASEPLVVPVDREQLSRALQNLVLNAMDAMPDGGTLRICTAPHEDGVSIQVSDTGQGLTAEECARLFTPYYTTKRHGTGLGLAIVQSVVSDHHGRISVASEPGAGARFTIVLPLGRNA